MYKGTTAPAAGVNSSYTVPAQGGGEEVCVGTIDEFIERMEALHGHARRTRRQAPTPRTVSRKAASNDRSRGREKIDLVLYTSPESEKSQKALRAVRDVLADYDESQIKFTVCDLSSTQNLEADAIVFTPTLVKRSPGPRTWIVGNLEHRDLLIDMLEVSGVQRRR